MIVLTTMVVVLGVAMGAAVQKKTYFLYPVDAFTLLLFFFVGVQILAQYLPPLSVAYIGVDAYWYVPLVIGYIAGYIVSGRTRYIMIRCFNPDKSTYGEHWILYTKDGRTYRQEQSNRELFKRLLFHVEHEVVSNADLVPDWDDVTSYPLFPEFRKKFLMAEWWETYEIPPEKKQKYVRRLNATIEVEPRFYMRRYVTSVRVARGSMVSRMDLVHDAKALDRMQGDLIEANNEIFRLRQSLNIRMADTVAEFLADVYSTARHPERRSAWRRGGGRRSRERRRRSVRRMLGKKEGNSSSERKERKKPRKMSKILTEAIVSGDEWLETVQIIQALGPVKDLVQDQIDGFDQMLDRFSEMGGTIERGELEDGYFQIRFSLRDSHWTKFFDPQGNEVRDIKDDRSGSKDPDAMTQIAYAMRASLEIPRREFVKEELERLESYLESDNTLAGVEKMKKIFEEDPATLFEAASAVVPDAVESDVDMSAVVDARGKA